MTAPHLLVDGHGDAIVTPARDPRFLIDLESWERVCDWLQRRYLAVSDHAASLAKPLDMILTDADFNAWVRAVSARECASDVYSQFVHDFTPEHRNVREAREKREEAK